MFVCVGMRVYISICGSFGCMYGSVESMYGSFESIDGSSESIYGSFQSLSQHVHWCFCVWVCVCLLVYVALLGVFMALCIVCMAGVVVRNRLVCDMNH